MPNLTTLIKAVPLLLSLQTKGGFGVDALRTLGTGREDRHELLGVWDWNSSDTRKRNEWLGQASSSSYIEAILIFLLRPDGRLPLAVCFGD